MSVVTYPSLHFLSERYRSFERGTGERNNFQIHISNPNFASLSLSLYCSCYKQLTKPLSLYRPVNTYTYLHYLADPCRHRVKGERSPEMNFEYPPKQNFASQYSWSLCLFTWSARSGELLQPRSFFGGPQYETNRTPPMSKHKETFLTHASWLGSSPGRSPDMQHTLGTRPSGISRTWEGRKSVAT
jgi:hypothetical protein